ncbi:NAD(P)-dependent oxidoreductase [Nocardia cyriacigeorgica]|uniref:NAD(P)-dependent oxidoreductase n=1 Tax=Nocardia cyriacigeorgica TaxID=135487 RepID=A0ABX0CNY7_9NOCA|nr:NAD(P)-binding domain-containing protein [Nocardia cyriacigeorgica]NEW53123.1 NAD(P)-dependent oxidoreductase [Nocardia cyriacigeorgica]NEW57168.1 NAD(P)-dependent oxidoreductase [Nocardia cyriacigeorgica]
MATQHSNDTQPVTLVGLGPMGLALAHTLIRKGHPLTVWNRSPDKADELVARGARRAATVAEAIDASPLTIVCLADYPAMYKVFTPAVAALAGRTLINLNSGTPSETKAAAAWSGEHDIDYLDGAIMVPPPMVGEPGAVFLYSGATEVFDRHRSTLTSLGDPRHLGDAVELAVLYNTALLHMMYATMNGWLQATAMVGSAHVSAQQFADLALDWFMPTVLDPASLAARAPDLDARRYPGTLGTMVMNLNGLEHITRTSEEQSVDTEMPRAMQRIAERAIAEGHGADNYLSTFEVFRKATPLP